MTNREKAARIRKRLAAAEQKVAAIRDERDAVIRDLRAEGAGLQAIAGAFGVSVSQVHNVLGGDRTGGSYARTVAARK